MKNQYFGDNRDLFKYDLALEIVEAGLVESITYIPMLTKGQGDEDDRGKASAGHRNKALRDFLDRCRRQDGRNIRRLPKFFGDRMVVYWGDGENRRFSNHKGQRGKYFSQIPEALLAGALVLVDPDKGLEVTKSGKEHLLYSEVNILLDSMRGDSILMIFQWIPREKRPAFLDTTASTLSTRTGASSTYISDGQVAFFLLTKTKTMRTRLKKVLNGYASAYDLASA